MKYLSIFDVVIGYLIAPNHHCTVYSSDVTAVFNKLLSNVFSTSSPLGK